MKVLITRPMPDTVLAKASARFDVTVHTEGALSPAQARRAMAEYDAILCTLGDGFSAEAFAPDLRCRLVANFGVGFNHIDVQAARAHGIEVTNTPGAVTDATADIAMTLLLMTARRAAEGERLVRSGAWTGWEPMQMLGTHVTGKTVGIVGMGRIGQAVARRCHFGFGMPVQYISRSPKDLDFPATRAADLHALMSGCDMVVLTLPGGAQTRHVIDAAALAAMPRHGILINVARGDVMDETALIAALEERRIAGAGLDVYEHEPAVPDALRRLDNVTLLPHLGTAALEVREDMGLMAVDNLIAHADGRSVPNPV